MILTNSGALLAALAVLAGNIQVTNGFQTDAGLQTYTGREGFSEEDSFPLVSAIFVDEVQQKQYPGSRIYLMLGNFELSGLIQSDPATPASAAMSLLSDFKRAVFGPQAPADLRSLVVDVQPAGGAVLSRVDGALLAQTTLRLQLQWQEAIYED